MFAPRVVRRPSLLGRKRRYRERVAAGRHRGEAHMSAARKRIGWAAARKHQRLFRAIERDVDSAAMTDGRVEIFFGGGAGRADGGEPSFVHTFKDFEMLAAVGLFGRGIYCLTGAVDF